MVNPRFFVWGNLVVALAVLIRAGSAPLMAATAQAENPAPSVSATPTWPPGEPAISHSIAILNLQKDSAATYELLDADPPAGTEAYVRPLTLMLAFTPTVALASGD